MVHNQQFSGYWPTVASNIHRDDDSLTFPPQSRVFSDTSISNETQLYKPKRSMSCSNLG